MPLTNFRPQRHFILLKNAGISSVLSSGYDKKKSTQNKKVFYVIIQLFFTEIIIAPTQMKMITKKHRRCRNMIRHKHKLFQTSKLTHFVCVHAICIGIAFAGFFFFGPTPVWMTTCIPLRKYIDFRSAIISFISLVWQMKTAIAFEMWPKHIANLAVIYKRQHNPL